MMTDELYKSFLESKDPLRAFGHWYLGKMLKENCLPVDTVFKNIKMYNNASAVVLFRRYPFQVELFIAPGNVSVPEHSHPDVDSYEVYFGGDIAFSKNNRKDARVIRELPNKKSSAWGWFMRIGCEDKHEATSLETGGSFLSVQYWKNKVEATSIGENWIGER